MAIEISQVFEKLLTKKRLFNSEADLQFALAWEIQTQYPNAEIRLEYVPWDYNPQMHIDIVVYDNNKLIPIELKYKTKGFIGEYNKENIVLKNHGAQDHGRYDFIKDIQRLEGFCGCKNYNVGTGYAIFLTNDSKYWLSNDKNSIDNAFRIHEGNVVSGDLNWEDKAGFGSVKGRPALRLKGNYKFNWNVYNLADNLQFKYTIIKVENKREITNGSEES